MMNEKIKELAKQSGFYFYDLHNIDGQDYGETIEADSWNAAEKFAEMIIRECFDVVIADGRFHDARRVIRAGKSVALEHFGVEE